MSQPPPPYPGDEKGGSYPQQPNPSYPPNPQYPPPFTNLQRVGTFASKDPTKSREDKEMVIPPIVNQPILTVIQQYKEFPIPTKCPFCQADIVTVTNFKIGKCTYLVACVLCCFGCACCCCFVPFCVQNCKDVEHRCPKCKSAISRYKRMSNES